MLILNRQQIVSEKESNEPVQQVTDRRFASEFAVTPTPDVLATPTVHLAHDISRYALMELTIV